MRALIKILILSFLVVSTNIGMERSTYLTGAKLSSVEDIKQVLFSGRSVRVVNFYSKCQGLNPVTGKERSGVDAVGGMIIETFEYFGEDVFPDKPPYLAASKAQMVYVGDRFYKDYVKMRFFENNRVEIISMFLDPETNEIIPLHDFKCEVNSGNGSDGGVHAYVGP